MTPAVQREAVAHLQACHGMSERRACRVTGADRKSMRYRSQRGDDAEVREKLRELAQQRRRFGYRRLHILLRREGVMISRKKNRRLYRERADDSVTRFNRLRGGEYMFMPSLSALRWIGTAGWSGGIDSASD